MELQDRDLEILKFCLEQKFATLLQIGKMFFPESRDIFHRPVKRVCELVNEGLLKAEQLRVCEKKLYVTTKAGVKLLKQKGRDHGLQAVGGLDTRTLEHDETVTEVRIIFDRLLGLSQWTPERVLKQKAVKAKVPDGLVEYHAWNFAVEVERTLKNKRYYEKIFNSDYTRQDGIYGILYIMNSESDMKWLMNEAKDTQGVFFTTLQDLDCMPYGKAPFVNASHELIEMRLNGPGSVHFADLWEESVSDDEIDPFDDMRKDDEEYGAIV